MKTHKDLDAWKHAMDLVTEIYSVTTSFPKEELYGLTSQMRRSVVSIPSNIAEGAARKSDREMSKFLHISLGSIAELETQVIISERLSYLSGDQSTPLLVKIKKVSQVLQGLTRSIESNIH